MKKNSLDKKKKVKIMPIILMLIIMALAVIIGINYSNKKESQRKIEREKDISERKKKYKDLIFYNMKIEKTDTVHFTMKVKNIGKKKNKSTKIKMRVLDKNGDKIIDITTLVPELLPNTSADIDISTLDEVLQAKDFTIIE